MTMINHFLLIYDIYYYNINFVNINKRVHIIEAKYDG